MESDLTSLIDRRITEAEAYADVIAEFVYVIDGVNLMVRLICDLPRNQLSTVASVEIGVPAEFVENVEADLAEAARDGTLVAIRHTMWFEAFRPGVVTQTTEGVAESLCAKHVADRITEEEARAWVRRKRQIAGGWMDATEWRRFTASFKRVRVAGMVKRAA